MRHKAAHVAHRQTEAVPEEPEEQHVDLLQVISEPNLSWSDACLNLRRDLGLRSPSRRLGGRRMRDSSSSPPPSLGRVSYGRSCDPRPLSGSWRDQRARLLANGQTKSAHITRLIKTYFSYVRIPFCLIPFFSSSISIENPGSLQLSRSNNVLLPI